MPKRIDVNQGELVDFLRALGFSVALTSSVGDGFPDIVVGGQMPCPCGSGRRVRQSKIVEIKAGKGILTPDQVEFHGAWRGQLTIIRDRDQALQLVGQSVRRKTVPPSAK
jgi:hypothetical protein